MTPAHEKCDVISSDVARRSVFQCSVSRSTFVTATASWFPAAIYVSSIPT